MIIRARAGELVDLSAVEAVTGRPCTWILKHGRAGWVPLIELSPRTFRVRRGDLRKWVAYSNHLRSWEHLPIEADPAAPACVYFVRGRIDRRAVGPVKIGYSLDPVDRLATLQCGSPIELRIAATIPAGPVLERKLHIRFSPWRSHGEWFHYEAPGLADLIRAARAGRLKNSNPAPNMLPEGSHAA